MTEASALRFKAMASCLLALIPPGSQSTRTVEDQYRALRGWTWWPSLKTMEGLECCQWSAGSNLYTLSLKTPFLLATKTILCLGRTSVPCAYRGLADPQLSAAPRRDLTLEVSSLLALFSCSFSIPGRARGLQILKASNDTTNLP